MCEAWHIDFHTIVTNYTSGQLMLLSRGSIIANSRMEEEIEKRTKGGKKVDKKEEHFERTKKLKKMTAKEYEQSLKEKGF